VAIPRAAGAGEKGLSLRQRKQRHGTQVRDARSGRSLRLVDGETKVTDEVVILPAPGHSAGHAAVALASGGETALYIGDIAQVAVQLERTAWVAAFDILPLVSMETKRALVERAIEDGSLIISVHAPFPGLGRLARTQEGHRRWTPLSAG